MVKYSYDEHERSYQQIAREGLTTWNQLHEAEGFEEFANRPFLEFALARLGLRWPDRASILEYGCGTGPAACFLAERGFRVHAMDLSPTAIALAREFASQRGLSNDLILDSFCLQSVVTDSDRSDLLSAVRERLQPPGFYLISTAMYDGRTYGPDECYDPVTGICEVVIPAPPDGRPARDGDVSRNGVWFRPHRRHLTPEALRAELNRAGFTVIWQGGVLGGDLVCRP